MTVQMSHVTILLVPNCHINHSSMPPLTRSQSTAQAQNEPDIKLNWILYDKDHPHEPRTIVVPYYIFTGTAQASQSFFALALRKEFRFKPIDVYIRFSKVSHHILISGYFALSLFSLGSQFPLLPQQTRTGLKALRICLKLPLKSPHRPFFPTPWGK